MAIALPLAEYRLHFTATGAVELPPFAGSTWRGAFGHALLKLVCGQPQTTCATCLLQPTCLYPYLFETPASEAMLMVHGQTAAPHPYLIRPLQGGRYKAGASLAIELVLVGERANAALPHLLAAFEHAVANGIGQGNGRLRPEAVEQREADGWAPLAWPAPAPQVPEPPPLPEQVNIELLTPLRLRQHNRYLGPEHFSMGAFLIAVVRRLSLLAAIHADTPPEADFAGLAQQANGVQAQHTALQWHDWARWSNRQARTIKMGGLLGHIALDGPSLAPFWPWLWLGQYVHAGKGCVMGLGQYRVPCG